MSGSTRTGDLGVGLLFGLIVGTILLGSIAATAVVVFLAVTLAFAIAYSAIVVSISATTGSTTRATTLALGFFVVFELVWDIVPMGIVYVVEGFRLPAQLPDWVFLVTQVSPSSAYFTSIVALLPDLAADVGAASAQTGVEVSTDATAEPFYVTPEVGLVVLGLWIVVPLIIGYLGFSKADL